MEPDNENILLNIISNDHLVGEGTEHNTEENLMKVCAGDVAASMLRELS